MPPVMQSTPLSSHVSQIGYDEAQQKLYVVYKTGYTYIYHDVEPDVADSVINAPSVGAALHSDIKGLYNFTRG